MKNKRILFIKIIIILLICIIVVVLVKSLNKEKNIEVVEQEVIKSEAEENSVYYSKLEAYKEKERRKRNQSNVSVKIDSSLFNTFEEEPKGEDKVTMKVQSSEPVYVPDPASKPVQRTTPQNQAFRQLAEVNKPKDESKGQDQDREIREQQAKLNDRERRLKEMQSSWASKSNSSTKKTGYHKAVVHGTQELRSGQTVVLRTKEPIRIDNTDIPVNTILNGVLAIRNNRAEIRIASARVNNQVFPVQLQVFGMDGMAGIPIDQSTVSSETSNELTREAVNEARKLGVVGKIAGSVVSSVTREKKQTIILVDAQNLLLQ